MSAGLETELKLAVSSEAIATLIADAAIFGPEAAAREQVSTYFDTTDHALAAAGLSLRIRRIGARRIQTVKAESSGTASLFARREWERDVAGDVPELDAITEALAALDSPPGDFAPVFVTEVARTKVERAQGESRVELVADVGRIAAGDRTVPIAELELELIHGDRRALFDLARELAGRVPARLGVRTKSERGYALLRGGDAKAIKAEPIALADDLDAAALFEAVAGACLRHFRLNEDLFLATRRAEPLHQARVALRRLRSALTIFREMLAGAEYERLRGELRWLSALLGGVRDIDVLIPRIEDESALGQLHDARDRAAGDVVEALGSDRARTLMLDLATWIAVGGWRDDAAVAAVRATPAPAFAHAVLDRLRRRMKKRGANLARLDDEARHEVRIIGKKLRYAAEFFAALFAGRKASRRRERFLDQLEALQTALGDLNDLASARGVLAALGIIDGEALLRGGKRKSPKALLGEAESACEALIDEKRFWR